jgi:hypothetical protein
VGGKRRQAAAQSPAAALRGGELAGLDRKRPSGHGLGSGLDWEQGRDMAKPSRAAAQASVAGAELAAEHGGWWRRRTRPGGAERERGREGACEIHNLGGKFSDGSGTAAITQNGGAAAGSELELVNGDGARVSRTGRRRRLDRVPGGRGVA